MDEKNQLVLFKPKDGQVSLPVTLERETVWLSQRQMADLFGKDRTVIGRHIRNAIAEGEIDAKTMCAKFAHATRYEAIGSKVSALSGRIEGPRLLVVAGYKEQLNHQSCLTAAFISE